MVIVIIFILVEIFFVMEESDFVIFCIVFCKDLFDFLSDEIICFFMIMFFFVVFMKIWFCLDWESVFFICFFLLFINRGIVEIDMFGFLVIFGLFVGIWENEEFVFLCVDFLFVFDNFLVRVVLVFEIVD